MNSYIMFKKKYIGTDSKTEYPQKVKFAIKDIKDGYYYFLKDKVEVKLENKLYIIGEIQSGFSTETKGDKNV